MSSQSINRKINVLKVQMADAAAAEDYERAAQLRNEIADLEPPIVRKPPPGQMGLGTNVPVAEPPKNWKPPK